MADDNENMAAAEIVAGALAKHAQKDFNDALDKYVAAYGSAATAQKCVQVAVGMLMGIVGYDENDEDATLKAAVAKLTDLAIINLDNILEEAIRTAPAGVEVPDGARRRLAAIKAKQGVKLNG